MLANDDHIWTAARVADRFPGVNPMDVLRCDDLGWQVWLALTRTHDADMAARNNT